MFSATPRPVGCFRDIQIVHVPRYRLSTSTNQQVNGDQLDELSKVPLHSSYLRQMQEVEKQTGLPTGFHLVSTWF